MEGRVSLYFVLIDENVPVDPAVKGAGELKDKDSFVAPVYSRPFLALAKQPAARTGSPFTSKYRSDLFSIAGCQS